MSQFIQDFRKKYTQYDDMPDDQLVNALHQKYYSDIPMQEFTQRIGYEPIQQVTGQQTPQQMQQPAPQIDAFTGATQQAPQQKSMLDLVGEKLANMGAGAVERAGDLGGAVLSTAKTVGEGLESSVPMGGLVWEDGDIIPSYKSPEEWAKTDAPNILQKGGEALKGVDLGYEEQANWQGVKDAFKKGGALSGSAYAEVLEYGLEQGVKSIPDMVATVYALPAYIFARSGEIGEQRAINKGKDKAELVDVLEAAPFATASALLERIGAKGMTSDAKAELGKDMLEAGIKEQTKRVAKAGGNALAKEAATEALQEGMIEYVGERFGTEAKMDFAEALDRAAAGAVAGGVFGGAIGAGSGIASEINYSPEKALGKAMDQDVAESQALGVNEEAISALSPGNAQLEAATQEQLESSEIWKNLNDQDKQKFTDLMAETTGKKPDPEQQDVEQVEVKPQEEVKPVVDEVEQSPEAKPAEDIAPETEAVEPKKPKPEKQGGNVSLQDLPKVVSDGIDRIKDKGDLELLKSNLEKIDKAQPVKFINAISSIANAATVKGIDGKKGKVIDVGRDLDLDIALEAASQLGIKSQGLIDMQVDRISSSKLSEPEKINELLKVASKYSPDKDYTVSIREFGLKEKIKTITGNKQAKEWLASVGGVKGMKKTFNDARLEVEKTESSQPESLENKTITDSTKPAELKAKADTITKDEKEIKSNFKKLDKKEVATAIKTPNPNQSKEQLIDEAYNQELYSTVAESGAVTTFNNSDTLKQQVESKVNKQTEYDIKKAANANVKEAKMDAKGKITYPQPEPDLNTEKYKRLDRAPLKPPAKGDRIFAAPGHNYVGLFRSTGIPERREFVLIDGKRVNIPKEAQRIEPIMSKLIKIMGRRIYFGKIKGKSSEGFYRPDVGEIRTRKKNDVEVLAHEMAHYLDFYSNQTLPNFKRLYTDPKYLEQVKALSYTDADAELMGIEGFAEFVRLWLTNSNEAYERAPGFYDAFNKLLKRDKTLNKNMVDMRDLMHKFYFQGPDKLGQALIGQDTSIKQVFDQWAYRRDSRIRQQVIDRFHAARKIEQELTNKVGSVKESAWKQLRLSNGGAEGISDYIMNYGTLNFNDAGDLEITGKSLHEVLEPVKSIKVKPEHKGDQKIDLLLRYFAGRRALELHRQGRENLIPKETAKVWARLGKDYPVFESIQKDYQAFNDRMMDFYEASGMITREGRKAMQSMNKDYVPFNRIREQLAGGKVGVGGGFQKLKGGTANLNDILVNVQDGIVANVRSALNNRAKQRLYQYIANHKDGSIFATRIAPDSKPVQVYADEMASKIGKVLEMNGIEFDGEIDLDSKDLLMFWQHGVKPKLNESGNIVDSVMIDGKPKYYEVQDPLLQDMLLAMNPESYSTFMNVMFGIKNFFTRSITLGIEFTGANLVRDTIGASFLSKNNFTPFLDSFKGMYSFIAKDKNYQDFMRSGGGYSSRLEAMTKEGTARRRVKLDEFGVMSASERLLSSIDNIASAFEYGTRIGEFRLAKKNGRSDMDAGFEAREISTDFSVLGANHFLTGYIRTVPFLNAMIQSQDRVFREAVVTKKYDGNPAGLAMKAFLGITVPTLVLYLVNKDDDDYKEIPDYEKRTNWHIKIGSSSGEKNDYITEAGGSKYIKIPRPYDVGFIYATMPELFFKYIQDDKGKEFADGMIWTLTQMYGIDGTPAMMTGWWDLVRNKKWTGSPVVPQSLSNVEAPEQYNSNTSETFVRLGEALNISPIKAEHMFKAYTGYLGGYVMAGTDHLLWDKERFGEKPERKLSENVFLSRFLTPEVRPSSAAMEKFFDLKEKSDKVVTTFKQTIDARRQIKGQGDDAGKFKSDTFYGLSDKEKEVLFGLNDSMNKIIKLIYGKDGIKTAELKIKYDKNLTAKQKREKMDKLWQTRNKIFLTYYKQADQALQKAKREAEQEK